MNTQTNNSSAIVCYSPDWVSQITYLEGVRAKLQQEKTSKVMAAQQDGFRAGYEAIKSAVQRAAMPQKPAHQMSLEELREAKRILREHRSSRPAPPPAAATVQGKREQNVHYPKRRIVASRMPAGQTLVFVGDECGQGVSKSGEDKIAKMNEEVLARVQRKMDAYQRPQRERVH